MGREDERRIEPLICRHGKIKIWRNRVNCEKCRTELKEPWDFDTERVAAADNNASSDLRRAIIGEFHMTRK